MRLFCTHGWQITNLWVSKRQCFHVKTAHFKSLKFREIDFTKFGTLFKIKSFLFLVLCGPPGSGKTMTLFSALRSLPDMEVVGLNFSSATTPELLLKTLDHYCEYRKTPNGIVLTPTQMGKWLIMFCDEINLPDMDKYGTQRVISFLRQMVEHNGFYRQSDQAWVTLDRIQFVGACNPPTDPGN